MRIGLFGGSFNPPHLSHTMAALFALETGAVERVIVMPCADHPFGKGLAPFEHRLAMCRLAFARLGEAVEVSDLEGRRAAPSYTIDTVWALRRLYPADDICLIVGSDILDEFEQWKDSEELRRLAPLIIVPRAPDREPESPAPGQPRPFALPAVSSTQLRSRLAKGEPVVGLIAASVLDYIIQHNLYR